MSLIIDGHNLIGAMPDIELADPHDEAQLLAKLRGYRSATGQALIVFFDSGDLPVRFPDLSSPGVQVRFSRPGQTADDAIVDFLNSRREPGQYAVVTNDRDLAFRARTAGASVMRSSDFATRLGHKSRRRPGSPLSAGPNPHDPAFADIYARFLQNDDEAGVTGSNQDAPAIWIERLYGDDAEKAQRAATWLGRYGDSRAPDALRDALTHGDPRVRAAAVLGLADLEGPGAVPDLVERLAHDTAGLVRQAAAEGLGSLGSRLAEPALEIAAATDPKSKVRRAARIALTQIRARRP